MSNSHDDEMKAFFPDPVVVRVADKDTKEIVNFEIGEFVFGNRIIFVKTMASIFRELAVAHPDMIKKEGSTDGIVAALIEIGGEKLIEVYALVLGRDHDWIRRNLTLKNEVALLTAILEVNDIPLLLSQIQKMIKSVKV